MKEPAVPASEFKAKCLRWLDEVANKHSTVLITKHGRPVARLVPVAEESARLRDTWTDSVRINGDIVYFGSDEEEWEASS